MKFTKMNGLSNDYIFIDADKEHIEKPQELARIITNPHRYIGGDGIVLIQKSKDADISMRIFNSDGSEGLMCGNALRCAGKYAYENLGIKKNKFFVETMSGIKTTEIKVVDGRVACATANVGKISSDNYKRKVKNYAGFCVSVGNPHFVTFVKAFPTNLEKEGQAIGKNELFSDGVNVEFVKKDIVDGLITMRVVERGSGETMSCGTGAAAAFFICRSLGLTGDSAVVCLPGGNIICYVKGEEYYISGAVEKNFEGEICF